MNALRHTDFTEQRLSERAADAERRAKLRRVIHDREYAAWRKHLEREFNVFVPSGAAEARFSRRMEAQMPALLEAAEREGVPA